MMHHTCALTLLLSLPLPPPGKLRRGAGWWVELIELSMRLDRDVTLVQAVKQSLADSVRQFSNDDGGRPGLTSMARRSAGSNKSAICLQYIMLGIILSSFVVSWKLLKVLYIFVRVRLF